MKGFIKLSVVAIAAGALVGFTSTARAMSVSLDASAVEGVADANGTTGLYSGDLVEIGTTTASKAAIDAAFLSGPSGSSTANALFSVWQTGSVEEGVTPGQDSTFVISSSAAGSATFFSKPIYLVVFNAAATGPGVNMGVYTAYPNLSQGTPGSPAGDPWTFPASDTLGEIFPSTGDVTASGLVLGGMGTDTDPNSYEEGYGTLFLQQSIPEPSTVLLVLVGLLGGIGLIRRRR